MFFSTDGPGDLIFLSWIPDSTDHSIDDIVAQGFGKIADYLQYQQTILLHERIYGESKSSYTILQERKRIFDEKGVKSDIPPTFVEGTPFSGSGVAGIHAVALQGKNQPESTLLEWQGEACGRIVTGNDARYLTLSDVGRLVRETGGQSPGEETSRTFELIEHILDKQKWKFNDVRRTWFYLHNILDWYDEFNLVRNDAFKRMGLFNGNPLSSIPASTGIQGRNADGGWCTLDLLAMKPIDGQTFEAKRLINPKQNEAPEYGSAFARALSVETDSCQYIFVSGTAAIDEKGVSVFEGDFERQTVRTLENVQALLEVGGAGLDDICQATSFVKRPQDVEMYYSIASRMGLDKIPVVCTLADVCRDELLYELDATAILSK